MKDLGLLIQDHLMGNDHIKAIIKKANTNLYFLKRTLGPLAPDRGLQRSDSERAGPEGTGADDRRDR